MKNYSTIALPKEPQIWKNGEYAYYFNHKDNGLQKDGEEGKRFEAEFTIIKSLEKGEIEQALKRHFIDSELEQKVIDNIEVDSKPAIVISKTYNVDALVATKIATITEAKALEEVPVTKK